MVQLSVLDLAYIGEGFTPADALSNSLDLAQHAESAGFGRFWMAEHHNLAGIASAAARPRDSLRDQRRSSKGVKSSRILSADPMTSTISSERA